MNRKQSFNALEFDHEIAFNDEIEAKLSWELLAIVDDRHTDGLVEPDASFAKFVGEAGPVHGLQ
jgi:hypothetical protein